MKKKLEAELLSIAHRILQLKNKSDLLQLHKEAQNLYEKLSLLKFVEENFADAKPTIGYAEIESQIESAFEKEEKPEEAEVAETKSKTSKKPATKEEVKETEAIPAEITSETETAETPETEEKTESSEEEISENETEEGIQAEETPEAEETPDQSAPMSETETPETAEQPESLEEVNAAHEDESADDEEIPAAEDAGVSEAGEPAPKEDNFMPSFELAFDKKEATKEEPKEQKQIAFEDFLGHDYNESFFVKADEARQKKEEVPVEEKQDDIEAPPTSGENEINVNEAEVIEEKQPDEERAEYKPLPSSDHLSKSITIGLNDRIGFEKQLFGGSSEDLNRVLSQLNTFDSFEEAHDFIEDMVKPDYNNWEGKDDYAQRFMDIVEKKFS